MFQNKRIGAVLLMGGIGQRFGSDTPKQFHLIANKPIYQHTLEVFLSMGLFDEIILVTHKDWTNLSHEGVKIALGGKTRQESSYLGLKAFQTYPDIVMIHDAVRPFVDERILRDNILGAIQFGAIDTCIPSADTIVHAPSGEQIASIPCRGEYLRGQTPQTFRSDWILKAHEKAIDEGIENASDDCKLVLRIKKPVHIVLGNERNIKITSEFDLLIAEQIICKELCR